MARPLILSLLIWVTGVCQSYAQPQNMCESLIRRYEAAHGIPHKLLTAISLVESGRKVQGSVVAWPWTINAKGKPYVFASKKEAIAMVRKLRHRGVTSIDVGCMQVNLKQHPGAFSTLDAAFDPATNIAYAAKFLKEKKMNKGSWSSAVAHYHSATAKFHVPYKARVFKTWAKVQNRRSNFPELYDVEQPSIISLLEKHQGEFVKSIATPSGRRVPMIVRFAPYRGIGGEVVKSPTQKSKKQRQDVAPVVVIDGKPRTIGKVIVNKIMMPNQKHLKADHDQMLGKVIHLSTKTKQGVPPRKLKGPVTSKFRAKSR